MARLLDGGDVCYRLVFWIGVLLAVTTAVNACPFAAPAAGAGRLTLLEGPSPTLRASGGNCSVSFQGRTESFQACRIGLQAGISVYWNINGSNIDTLFAGKPVSGGYIAWGWGSKVMVGASAAVAFTDPDSGKAIVSDYYMSSTKSAGVQVNDKQNISKSAVEISPDGTITAYFTRPLGQLPRSGSTNAIWAVGPKVKASTRLDEHANSGKAYGTLDLSQSATGDSAGGTASEGSDYSKVLQAHMFMMGFGWLILAPLGVFGMRYLKRYNPGTFQTHRGVMSFLVLFIAIAFVLGLLEGSRQGFLDLAHLGIGTIALVLAVLQVVSGFLRPDKESPRRKSFNLAHWWGGRSAVVLGAVNSFIGLALAHAGAKAVALTLFLVVAWIAAFVIFSYFLRERFPIQEQAPIDPVWSDGQVSQGDVRSGPVREAL
jgi:hypothetical protein